MRPIAALATFFLAARVALAGPAPEAYALARERLDLDRQRLGEALSRARGPADRRAVIAEARRVLVDALRDGLVPPWLGTRWAFHGTSETPGEGTIACGYFVSTLLRDAGFRVERVRLAQQASEYIVATLAPRRTMTRHSRPGADRMVESIRARGDGVFVVGFDFHVGLVVVRGASVEFCHSTYLGASGVLCEDPLQSGAFVSNYYVVGALTSDATLARWLEGDAFATARR